MNVNKISDVILDSSSAASVESFCRHVYPVSISGVSSALRHLGSDYENKNEEAEQNLLHSSIGLINNCSLYQLTFQPPSNNSFSTTHPTPHPHPTSKLHLYE